MKQDIYLPLKMLRALTTQYPIVWKEMEEFHDMNGTASSVSWPE